MRENLVGQIMRNVKSLNRISSSLRYLRIE